MNEYRDICQKSRNSQVAAWDKKWLKKERLARTEMKQKKQEKNKTVMQRKYCKSDKQSKNPRSQPRGC